MADQDYPYIRAWGSMMLSYAAYIRTQVELARQENAPQNATFRDDDGTWRTIEDCRNESTVACIEAIVARPRT